MAQVTFIASGERAFPYLIRKGADVTVRVGKHEYVVADPSLDLTIYAYDGNGSSYVKELIKQGVLVRK